MNPEAEKILEPSRPYYRLTFLFGTFVTPLALGIAQYLHEELPYKFHYFYFFSIISFLMFLWTYKKSIQSLRIYYIIVAFLFCIYFKWLAYSINFHYSTLVAQILLLVSATFVMLRLRELIGFLFFYVLFDLLFTYLNWDTLLTNQSYKTEYIHYHIFIFSMVGIAIISLFSRRTQVTKLEEILKARELAYDFAKESRRQMEDMQFALNAASIVAITDSNGVITYANENFQIISGYSSKELLGKTHRIVNSGFHPPEFFKDMWDTILSGNVWKGEIRNKRKDGTYYWVATTIVPLLDPVTKKPSRFLSIRNDITPRKIAQEQLKESEEKFRKLYQSLKEELQLAAQTQKYLMPRIEPIPGFKIQTFVLPYLDVSGDLIAIKKSNKYIHLLLADIAGHGVSAALISALVVFAFHQIKETEIISNGIISPSQALFILRDKINSLRIDQFVCAVYLIIDIETKELFYSYAGQLPGILHRGGLSYPMEGKGTPLLPRIPPQLKDFQYSLKPGDKLLFFSDGVYEIKNPNHDYLGYERFCNLSHNILLSSNNPIEDIMDNLLNYSLNSPLDDISLLFVEVES